MRMALAAVAVLLLLVLIGCASKSELALAPQGRPGEVPMSPSGTKPGTTAPAPSPAKPQTPVILDLGSLDGPSCAQDINDQGDVVGFCADSRPFLWNAKDRMKDLAPLIGPAVPLRINNLGQIVGISFAHGRRAFFWDPKLGFKDIGLPGIPSGEAIGLNNKGQVVGQSYYPQRPFLWSADKGPRDLSPLVGGDNNVAHSINDAGVIAGSTSYGGGWILDTTNTLTVVKAPAGHNGIKCINARGQATGTFYSGGDPDDRLYLWDKKTGISQLASLGAAPTEPFDMNDAGDIVGFSTTVDRTPHAFLCRDGRVLDLNDSLPPNSGWVLTKAFGINSRNQIVGQGLHNGAPRAFLLTLTTP